MPDFASGFINIIATRNKKVKPRRALNNKSVKGSERKRSLGRIFLIIIYFWYDMNLRHMTS